MKNLPGLLACATLLLLFGSEVASAQNSDCRNLRFSSEILNRFPNAPGSCLDVITRDGQEYAVFRVQLNRVRGNTMQVRFHNPDGSRGPSMSVATDPEFRVLVDGRPTRVRDLAPNQELTAYVQASRSLVAIAPAGPTQVLHVVPLIVEPATGQDSANEDAARVADATDDPDMPDTAGSGPLASVIGMLLLTVAVAARAIRGVKALRRRRLMSL